MPLKLRCITLIFLQMTEKREKQIKSLVVDRDIATFTVKCCYVYRVIHDNIFADTHTNK